MANHARIAVALFGPPGQGGFNEAGARAAQQLRSAGIAVETHWIEERSPERRAAALARLCDAGLGLLVAHGGQGDAPVGAIAARYPAVKFAISQGSFLAPNVACYEVLQEQSAFLAGVLAASVTRSGVVAHFSGDRVRPGLKGRAAYCQGVAHADPGVRVLTGFCGNQHDPVLAERCVDALAGARADILFAMIDGGRPGAIRACRRHRMSQIGNVLDWTAREPDVFIASALADSGWGIDRAVRDFLGGQLACGALHEIGIEEPAVVSLKLAARVPAAAQARVEAARRNIVDGEISLAADYAGAEFAFPD
jgi:basic membrane protein A